MYFDQTFTDSNSESYGSAVAVSLITTSSIIFVQFKTEAYRNIYEPAGYCMESKKVPVSTARK